MITIALKLHKHGERLGSNKKETSQWQFLGRNTQLGYHTDHGPIDLGQYDTIV